VRAKTSLLVLLLCTMMAGSALPACVTTRTSVSNSTSQISIAASERAPTTSNADHNSLTGTRYLVTVGRAAVYTEAANTPTERETGLMNRISLDENTGMLFVLPTAQKMSFWMKNMYIPLDILFITTDMHVLEIYRSVPPCTTDSCVLYTPSAPIKYALEVNAGFSDQHGIASGDAVFITPLS
jgi:uncharacterized membrane protein (UPF0127 family)